MNPPVTNPHNLFKCIRARKFWLGLLFLLLFIPLTAADSYALIYKTRNLAIYATDPLGTGLQDTFNRLDSRIDELQMNLGIYVDARAEIRIVKDHKSYQQLALGKNKIVEFSNAFYSSREQRIYIRSATEIAESYLQVLMHEYIHWYLEKIFNHTPLWFHEGLATGYSGQMGFERYLLFLRYSFFGRHSDLFRMSYSYPENRSEWELFYLSSSMAVTYMRQKREKEWNSFWTLVSEQYRSGNKADFTHSFNRAFHSDLFSFHHQFRKYIKSLKVQYLIFSINGLLAMLLPFVLIAAHFRKRRRIATLPDLPEPVDEQDDPPEAIDTAIPDKDIS